MLTYRMKSKISLYKNAASAVYARRDAHCFGKISCGIYVGNEEQFVCKVLKCEMLKSGNKMLFFGLYNPRYCERIELYRKILFLNSFHSSTSTRESTSDGNTETPKITGWMTPTSVNNIEVNFENFSFKRDINSVHKMDINCGTRYTQ